jgi:ABC-2 type transport system ATP-binding protein
MSEQNQVIQVEFDLRIEEALLKKLINLKEYTNITDNVWELVFETEQDMRAEIFDFATQNGLRTLQINRKIISLESLFQNLTK